MYISGPIIQIILNCSKKMNEKEKLLVVHNVNILIIYSIHWEFLHIAL